MKRFEKKFNSKRLTAIFLAASMLLTGNVSALAAADVSMEAAPASAEAVSDEAEGDEAIAAAEDEVALEEADEALQVTEDAADLLQTDFAGGSEDLSDAGVEGEDGDVTPAPGGQNTDFPVDSEFEGILDVDVKPSNYYADFDITVNKWIGAYNTYIIYTSSADKDIAKGKAKAGDADFSDSVFHKIELDDAGFENDSYYADGKTIYRFTGRLHSGDEGETSLLPGTTYKYRLAQRDYDYSDGMVYKFISGQNTFTTTAGISQSKVAIKDIKVKNVGYTKADLSFKIDNPDDELIAYFAASYEGLQEPERLANLLEYDEDTKIYTLPMQLDAEKEVTLVAMVPTGNDGALTQIKSDPVKVTPMDLTKSTLEASMTPAAVSAIARVKLTPPSEGESLSAYIYTKSAEDSEYQRSSVQFSHNLQCEGYGVINDLKPETEYSWYAEVKTGYDDSAKEVHFGSEETPNKFTTAAVKTYTEADFADKAFYDYLVNRYGKSGKLTSKELESVTQLDIALSDFDLPLKSLKGIENLVNLDYISVSGHDITDISGVEKLSCLRFLILRNNDLTDIPSLKEIRGLESIDLDGNKLTAEALTADKIPDVCLDVNDKTWLSDVIRAQRGEVALQMPEKFYAIGNTWPFFAKASDGSSIKDGRSYYISVEIDGKVIKSETGYSYDTWIVKDLASAGVSMAAGTKNVKVALFDQYNSKICETDAAVQFEADGITVTGEAYIMGDEWGHVYINVPDITGNQKVTDIKVLDASGKEAELGDNPNGSASVTTYDNRYSDFNTTQLKRQSGNVSIGFRFRNASAAVPGDYKISFSLNGKAYTVDNVIHVLKEGEAAVISWCGWADDEEYDQSLTDSVYVYLQGTGHYDAAKVWPVLKIGDTAYTGKYTEAEPYTSKYGFIYKLPKTDAWKELGDKYATFDVVLETPDDKFKVIDARSSGDRKLSYDQSHDPVLFNFYNYRTGYYTADVASFVTDGTAVNYKLEMKDDKGSWKKVVDVDAAVSGGKLRYELKDASGKAFVPEMGVNYRHTFTFPESIYPDKIFSRTYDFAYYNFDVSAYLKDTKTVYKAPLSKLDVKMVIKSELLNKDGENKVELIIGNDSTGKEVAKTEMTAEKWINKYKGEFTASVDLSAAPLTLGRYYVKVRVNGSDDTDGYNTFIVYDDAAFYMQYQNAWYVTDEKEGDYVRLNIEDPALAVDFATEKDGKKLWDERYVLQVFKRTMEGEKASWTEVTDKVTVKSVSDHSENSMNLYVNLTGLEKSEDGYWFRVTSKDGKNGLYILSKDEKGNVESYYAYRDQDEEHGMPGAAYRESTPSESSERVEFIELENEETGYGWYYGIQLYSPVYPYTIYVYAPGSTKELASISVKKGTQEKNSNYEYYYFTKNDLKALSNTSVYDMFVVNSIGKLLDDARGYMDAKDSTGENDTEEDVLPPVPTDVPTADDAPDMTASDKAEAVASYTKAAEEISSKKDGNGEAAKAAVDDTGVVIPFYKKGNVKSVAVESAKNTVKDFTVTVPAKTKVMLPGKGTYSIIVGDSNESVSGNTVSGNTVSGNVGFSASIAAVSGNAALAPSLPVSGIKVPKAKVGKDGTTMVAVKAVKGVEEYVLTCVSSEYTVRLHVVNAAFDKNIKKAALYSGAGEAGKGCGEMLVVGVTPRKFINGTWLAGKQVLNMGTNKVKCGKSFAYVYVMENGTAIVEPMTGASGSVKLTYTVSGKKFTTGVKVSAKPLNARQEAVRDIFKNKGLLKVPAAK